MAGSLAEDKYTKNIQTTAAGLCNILYFATNVAGCMYISLVPVSAMSIYSQCGTPDNSIHMFEGFLCLKRKYKK